MQAEACQQRGFKLTLWRTVLPRIDESVLVERRTAHPELRLGSVVLLLSLHHLKRSACSIT